MANNVYSSMMIRPTTDEGFAKLKEILERATSNPESDGNLWFGSLYVSGKEGAPTAEDVVQYSWMCDNVGPKWCHIEDYTLDEDDKDLHLVTNSAWSPPEAGLQKILEEIEEVDPNVTATMTYEDEMPNFIGWSFYVGSELEDGCEDDDEEIRDGIFHEYPHLKEHWDEDADEWATDEDGDMTQEAYDAEDEYRDVMYEYINEWQEKGLSDAQKYYEQRLEEEKE